MTILTRRFEAADMVRSPEGEAALLEDALKDADPAEIADLLGVIAKARGFASLAQEFGLSREELTAVINPLGGPRLSDLLPLLAQLGVPIERVAEAAA